mmetsp:Transcript_5409/g.17031  ORF Transcript_5409/g.17031 Transcript_5409/m.17031 type:complete len:515 (-) Transcript_5409:29-1573(-)
MIHPGMDTTRPADDPENFQRGPATGQAILEETHVYDANCQYVARGIRYEVPCQAKFDVKLDGNNRPISLTRRQPRLFTGQQYELEHTGLKPRQLCPTLIQIRRYFARDPFKQIDRPTRNAVAGGRRSPPKDSIQPIFTGGVFEALFIDTFRLPIAASIHEEHDATAQELLRSPSLMGGARRSAPARLKGYRWVFVGIDGTSKWCFIKEITQKSPLDVGQTTAVGGDGDSVGASSGRLGRSTSVSSDVRQHGNEPAAGVAEADAAPQPQNQPDDDGIHEKNEAKRPQSDQTYRAFKQMVKLANEVRREHTRRTGKQLKTVLPLTVAHDNGREFMGHFAAGFRGRNSGYFNESITSNSRSRHNAIGERAVLTLRRYMYAIKNAFERCDDLSKWPNRDQVAVRERGLSYDWTLDLPEVMRRYNTGTHSTIRCTPLEALLESVHPDTLKRRIVDAGKKRLEGLRHELPLPDFSPTSPPEVGSFVRLKEYVSGSMGSAWPVDGAQRRITGRGTSTWSRK